MTPVRAFVVAASPVVRAGLRSMLAGVEGVEVVGESATLAEPPSAGVEALVVADEELMEETAAPAEEVGAVVLLTDDERAVARLRSLSLPAWGVVSPEAPPEELAAAVVAAARGLVAMSGELAERLLGEVAVEEEGELAQEPLTAREMEVLGLLGEGLSNKMIARRLGISEHTVKFHVSSIYAKLGAGNRAEAVSRGARRGLIHL